MARRPHRKARIAELSFDAITIEGGLIAADWLSRIAQLEAAHQKPADYHVVQGLELRDEIARFWRIAQPLWAEFDAGRRSSNVTAAHTRRFIIRLLRDVFGFEDLVERPSHVASASLVEQPSEEVTQPLPLHGRMWPLTAIDNAGHLPVVCALPLPTTARHNRSGVDLPYEELAEDGRRRSAFGVLQEFLNASEEALWGLCSDGLTLRLARDNASMTRPAWIEVDLARIFTEGLFSEFAAAWLLLHRTRFGKSTDAPDMAPLEQWRTEGRLEGTRARDRLRAGFEDALQLLGQGFLNHPKNIALRTALINGDLTPEAYFGELLRLVYRLIFLLVVEERNVLHPKTTPNVVREAYQAGYSLQRLRQRSVRGLAYDRHYDLWEALKIVTTALYEGEDALGLPALGGLFHPEQCKHIDEASLDNRTLLKVIFRLCWLHEPSGLTRVNWRDMGSEELGYVYEGLLELVPRVANEGRTFSFAGDDESRGNVRKTTGSYYTPESLVSSLLDSALEPVIQQTIAENPTNPANALLKLAIVDPACGSGHFLLGAARRLAERIARLRSEGTPNPDEYRSALRDVVSRCIYGVDLNPLAVELCKVSLWMEAIDPGRPLTFLDAHIQVGNSLLGTSWKLMGDSVPSDAWAALQGDDKKIVATVKKRNTAESKGQETLFASATSARTSFSEEMQHVDSARDDTLAQLRAKERQWHELRRSEAWQHQKLVHDAWCAAFVWPLGETGPDVEHAPTTAKWLELRDNPSATPPHLKETTGRLAAEYAFFHWELAFAQVFERGGFDVVLGNPPWERVKLQEKEFFSSRDPVIANARTAAERKRLIRKLANSEHGARLLVDFHAAQRTAEGQSHFLRNSGLYPLTGTGDINTYQVFAERARTLLAARGRLGIILPTGIATDATTQAFFRDLVESKSLVSLYDFENRLPLFENVDSRFKFCLLTLVGVESAVAVADFAFFLREPNDLNDDERRFSLSPEEIILLNPNTGNCPVFRSRRDAEITLGIYRRLPVLINENDPDGGNPWGIRFMRMFDMSNDSKLFHSREELEADGWTLNGNIFERNKTAPPPKQSQQTRSGLNE